MKKVFKILGILLGVVILAGLAGFAFISFRGIPSYEANPPTVTVSLTADRVAQGEKLVNMLCVHCHQAESGILEGKFLAENDPAFGVAHASNITQDPEHGIGQWTDGELMYLLRTGIKRDGSYAPPYMPKWPLMADEDMEAIIAFLRSDNPIVQPSSKPSVPSQPSFLVKALCNTVIKPLPYPEAMIAKPTIDQQVAYGKYMVQGVYGCYACHSGDFTKLNEVEPEKSFNYLGGGATMLNEAGESILTPNITFDEESGIGTWTEDQFISLVKWGQKPDGTALKYPMVPYPNLDTLELRAIYAYLKTIPPVGGNAKAEF